MSNLLKILVPTDKRAAQQLSQQVEEACALLNEYNQRLAAELEERRKVAFMLRGFINQIKGQMQDTEKQLLVREQGREVSQKGEYERYSLCCIVYQRIETEFVSCIIK